MKFGIHIGHMGARSTRCAGCGSLPTRLSIAFRNGPYDWEALEAFAAEFVRG